MESVHPCGPGIEVQAAPARVAFDAQNVAVPADENTRASGLQFCQHPPRIATGTPTDVGHGERQASAFPVQGMRKGGPDAVVVDVPKHRANGRHLGQSIRHRQLPDVPGMPNLIHTPEMVQDAVVHPTVGIRKESDVHGSGLRQRISGFPAQIAPMKRIRFRWGRGVGVVLACAMVWAAVGQTQPAPKSKKARRAYEAATLAYMQQDLATARAQAGEAVRRDSTYFDAWMLLAQLAREEERWDEAAEAMSRGYDQDPAGYPAGRVQWIEALHRSGRYDEAAAALAEARLRPEWTQTRRKPEEAAREAARWEQLGRHVDFAQRALAAPVDAAAAPLPGEVNTPEPEYHPALTLDGGTLIFTRLVGYPAGGNGRFSGQEDFYRSRWSPETRSWQRAQAMHDINSVGNEGAPALRGDGRRLIFTACETPLEGYGERTGLGSCDLFEARWNAQQGRFEPAVNLGLPNTRGWESQPTLSADGRTLVFVRGNRRADGTRGQDLFVTRLLPDGSWSEAVPLPGAVNTDGNEENPVLHADGKTLYFASDGHPGMGGMDLFMSRLQPDGSWGDVTNLGFPINTQAHENSLVVGSDGRLALFATDRERPGDSDLWSMQLPEWAGASEVVAWTGRVFDAETLAPVEAQVWVLQPDGEVFAQMRSDAADGRFVLPMSQASGWIFQVEEPGYAFYSARHNPGGGEEPGAGPGADSEVAIGLRPLRPGMSFALRDVRFATASAQLEAVYQPELVGLARLLAENQGIRVRLVGHTDATGNARENRVLSEARAAAVRSFLIGQGIDPARLESAGRGADEPVADNGTAEGRAANRRTEVVILD